MFVTGDMTVLLTLTETEKHQLLVGRPILRGSKVYAICDGCRSLVRVNKPMLGSLHLCKGLTGR